MKALVILPMAFAVAMGFASAAVADHAMHHVYSHHQKHSGPDHHLSHRQACIGRSAGTAHHSCGTHTGGPSGGLH